jgi:hypothetical protein
MKKLMRSCFVRELTEDEINRLARDIKGVFRLVTFILRAVLYASGSLWFMRHML